ETAVLDRRETGDPFFGEAVDIFTGLGGTCNALSTDWVKHLCERPEPLSEGGFTRVVDASRMVRAQIAFEGADVICNSVLVVLHVSSRAIESDLGADHPAGIY